MDRECLRLISPPGELKTKIESIEGPITTLCSAPTSSEAAFFLFASLQTPKKQKRYSFINCVRRESNPGPIDTEVAVLSHGNDGFYH